MNGSCITQTHDFYMYQLGKLNFHHLFKSLLTLLFFLKSNSSVFGDKNKTNKTETKNIHADMI